MTSKHFLHRRDESRAGHISPHQAIAGLVDRTRYTENSSMHSVQVELRHACYRCECQKAGFTDRLRNLNVIRPSLRTQNVLSTQRHDFAALHYCLSLLHQGSRPRALRSPATASLSFGSSDRTTTQLPRSLCHSAIIPSHRHL